MRGHGHGRVNHWHTGAADAEARFAPFGQQSLLSCEVIALCERMVSILAFELYNDEARDAPGLSEASGLALRLAHHSNLLYCTLFLIQASWKYLFIMDASPVQRFYGHDHGKLRRSQ